MQGKVEICGVNTSRLKVLSQSEMNVLLQKAKNGDEAARQALIEGNLRLVLSVIQRFDKRGECPDDLFQVGCIGLIKAIANFDPDKQVRFSTYGVPMIAGEVRRYLRDNSAIRVSRSIRDVEGRSAPAAGPGTDFGGNLQGTGAAPGGCQRGAGRGVRTGEFI